MQHIHRSLSTLAAVGRSKTIGRPILWAVNAELLHKSLFIRKIGPATATTLGIVGVRPYSPFARPVGAHQTVYLRHQTGSEQQLGLFSRDRFAISPSLMR